MIRPDATVGERRHTFSYWRGVYPEHDLYGYCLDPPDTRCLEHSWGRLGLLGTALPAFTPQTSLFIIPED